MKKITLLALAITCSVGFGQNYKDIRGNYESTTQNNKAVHVAPSKFMAPQNNANSATYPASLIDKNAKSAEKMDLERSYEQDAELTKLNNRASNSSSNANLYNLNTLLAPRASDPCSLSGFLEDDTTSTQTWDRPFANGTCCSPIGPVSYEVYGPFTVDTAGNYTFDLTTTDWDSYTFLYSTAFDPLDQTVNFVAGDDDGPVNPSTTSQMLDIPLVTGTEYFLITTGFSAGDFGDYTNAITGPGTVTCGAPVSTTVECGQMQVSNAFEDGSFIEQGGGQRVSNDLVVGMNTTSFALNNITANLFSQGGIASVDITFFEDNNGLPGVQFGTTIEDLVPTSQAIIGTAFGFDAHEVVLDLATPVDFPGTGMGEVRYWIQLVAVPNTAGTRVAWETTYLNPVGLAMAFVNDIFGGPYTIDPFGADGVFTTSGDCTQSGCLVPENLVVSNITDTQANISWDAVTGAANGYIVSVFNAGDDPNTDTPIFTENVATGTLTSTATGLTGSTMYDAYVVSDCGGSISARNTISFETNVAPPICGEKFYDTGGPNGNFENNELYDVTVLPDNPGDLVTATFVFVNNSFFDILTVDIGDGNPQVVPEIPMGGTPISYRSIAADGSLLFNFDSSGTGQNAGWDADITCGPPPTCIEVSNLTVSNITETTADINWVDNNAAANGYIVEVFEAGDDPNTDTPVFIENVASGTFVSNATGLSESSNYDVYVTADCGGGDLAETIMTSFITSPACGGVFVDSGGLNGNYSVDETITTTITPDNSGDSVTITFTYVDIESSTGAGNQDGCYDYMSIFNGPSASSPVLAATLCGEESGDGGVPSVPSSLLSVGDQFTSTDPSGALTIVFTSDNSVTETGWRADVTCAILSLDDKVDSIFNFYPNPTTDILQVSSRNTIDKIEVYNIVGQKIIELSPNELDAEVDFSEMPIGVYILNAEINGKVVSKRVIKK